VTRPPRPTKYKHGDIHSSGRIFKCYKFQNNIWYELTYSCTTKEDAHIIIMYNSALERAKREQSPFDIDIEFLKSIKTNFCPIFGIPLSWGSIGQGYAKNHETAPSLDKIKPEYGYIKGNVCIISNLANKIKQNVGCEELYKIADWLHEKLKEVEKNVKPEQLTSIPTRSYRTRKNDTQLSLVLTPGPWEDGDDLNDYRGAVQGENAYRSAKEGR
jgi:hypothetical protein